jgi:hypothetical protein
MDDVANLKTEIDRLTAEHDALRADAARYRWLRENGIGSWIAPMYAPALDARIDAALKGER